MPYGSLEYFRVKTYFHVFKNKASQIDLENMTRNWNIKKFREQIGNKQGTNFIKLRKLKALEILVKSGF